MATRLNGQYEYALDHLKQMVRDNSGIPESKEYTMLKVSVDLFYWLIVLGCYAAAFYYFEPFKHAEQFGSGESKMSFEIKRAKDIE
jgi:hypothetical protein